ncbi:MAG: hypothetical protein HOQ21_09840 [Dermatophilaceae bacterium]|nr:hypothetical protein [Dermatophilaceae bacterium]
MTRIDTVVENAAHDARDNRRHKGLWIGFAAVLTGLVLAGFALWSLAGRVDELSGDASDNARAAQQLAEQVRQLGGVPIVQPPTPERGPQGDQGPAGRGIAGTAIVDGRLLIAYDDGTSRDVGPVVGQPGANGADGRGVIGTAIVAGRLVLSYSDSSTEDVGQVVGTDGDDGAPGRGVTSVAAVDGRLVVTYSDGTAQDAGPLPAGPPGRGVQRAEVVDCRWRVTYTDGTTEDAGSACTTETVTPSATTTTAGLPLPLRPSR